MTSDEGLWQSIPPDPNGGEAPDMSNASAWPHAPYEAPPEPVRRGWMTIILAALGSAMRIMGAAAMWFLRRRASAKRRGIMAAMPSNLAGAEQMMRDRMSAGMPAAGGGGKMRAVVAILAVALASWGLRRTFAHS